MGNLDEPHEPRARKKEPGVRVPAGKLSVSDLFSTVRSQAELTEEEKTRLIEALDTSFGDFIKAFVHGGFLTPKGYVEQREELYTLPGGTNFIEFPEAFGARLNYRENGAVRYIENGEELSLGETEHMMEKVIDTNYRSRNILVGKKVRPVRAVTSILFEIASRFGNGEDNRKYPWKQIEVPVGNPLLGITRKVPAPALSVQTVREKI